MVFRRARGDACKAWSDARHEQAEIDEVVERVPDVSAWPQEFQGDKLRYPLLIVLGASASCKTQSLPRASQSPQPSDLKVGSTEVFPAKMGEFGRA